MSTTPTLEDALYTLMTSDAGVSLIIRDCIYPVGEEGISPPYVLYEIHDLDEARTRDGYTGHQTCRVVFNCVGRYFDEGRDLANAIRKALPLFGGVWEGIRIKLATPAGSRDYLASAMGSTAPLGRQLDFNLIFTEEPDA
ncbi:MAG: hypothetical protein AAF561_00125 [Planctomycetota bacterium]